MVGGFNRSGLPPQYKPEDFVARQYESIALDSLKPAVQLESTPGVFNGRTIVADST